MESEVCRALSIIGGLREAYESQKPIDNVACDNYVAGAIAALRSAEKLILEFMPTWQKINDEVH